jgi:hypothetical protein
MVTLREKESGQYLGKISDEEMQFLLDELEEESREDTDYYLDADTVDLLEENGAPSSLTTLLRNLLDGRDGMDIQWSRG